MSATDTSALPDYTPVPRSAFGPALNEQGYYVGRVAALKGYLDEITRTAAAPVIEKYTGTLAAADVFTESTTFHVMQSIRLDLGYGSQVHP
jgi:hypothetical protein